MVLLTGRAVAFRRFWRSSPALPQRSVFRCRSPAFRSLRFSTGLGPPVNVAIRRTYPCHSAGVSAASSCRASFQPAQPRTRRVPRHGVPPVGAQARTLASGPPQRFIPIAHRVRQPVFDKSRPMPLSRVHHLSPTGKVPSRSPPSSAAVQLSNHLMWHVAEVTPGLEKFPII